MSDQKDLSTLLAELDAAVAKMTPGPWRAFVRDIEQMSDGVKGYPLNVYPDCATVHVGHPTVDDERTGNVGLRRQEDIDGIVALVNAYPRLREAIEQLQQDLSKVPLPRKSPDNVEAWAQKLAEDTGNADD